MRNVVAARVALMLIALGSALAGCGEGAPKQAAPPPPAVTVAKPQQADGHRLRRICRALRRGRLGRGPRARLRLSRQGAFQGRADRQAGRSPVHASTGGRSRPRSRRRAPTWRRRAPISPTPKATSAAPRSWCATAPSRSRSSSSAPRPSASPKPRWRQRRRRCARPSSTSQFTELKAPVDRPDRRPPRVARQPGDRRHRPATPRCSPPSCRSTRSASSSPSMRPRSCATSGSARKARTSTSRERAASRSRSS